MFNDNLFVFLQVLANNYCSRWDWRMDMKKPVTFLV